MQSLPPNDNSIFAAQTFLGSGDAEHKVPAGASLAASAVICHEPNQHARPPKLALTPDMAAFQGYQSFAVSKDEIAVLPEDEQLQRKQQLLSRWFAPRFFAHRDVLDLGGNSGFYSFWALQNGAASATSVDMDQQYNAMAREAALHLGFDKLRVVEDNVANWVEPADNVLALALVHWLYSCTATFGSLPAVCQRLAQLTKYMLIVEFVDPADSAIEFFHHLDWNPQAVQGPYTREAFEAALSGNFARVSEIGRVSPTRTLYVAFRTPQEIDLSGPLLLLREKESVISSRCLDRYEDVDYWSCVYELPDSIEKQTTGDLADREYAFLTELSGSDYFPRPSYVETNATSSVVGMERVAGVPLGATMDEIRSDPSAFQEFLADCLSILEQLGEKGIQHRDIRPDNVLVRGGKPVLIDFAWAISDRSPYWTPNGLGITPGWNARTADGSLSDVYAMGKVLASINDGRYAEFAPLIGAMMDEDPISRVTNVAELRRLLPGPAVAPQDGAGGPVEAPSGLEAALLVGARALAQVGDTQAQYDLLDAASRYFPEDLGIRLELAGLLAEQGFVNEATAILGVGLDQPNPPAELYLQLAEVLEREGRDEDAANARELAGRVSQPPAAPAIPGSNPSELTISGPARDYPPNGTLDEIIGVAGSPSNGTGLLPLSLEDLGPLYHDYAFFGARTVQLPGNYGLNQRAKEPVIRAYIDFALAAVGSGAASDGDASFLELFCADGYYAMLARKLGATRAVGIDNDGGGHLGLSAEIAGRLGLDSVEFVKMDITEMEGLGQFDIVANEGGLCHVSNPTDILDASYRAAKKFLVVQSVVSLANHDDDYFEAPAPGWTWGCRYSRESFDKMIRSRHWDIVDSQFNELKGNDRLEDRGSVYYLVRK